jgi:hypothetical protein
MRQISALKVVARYLQSDLNPPLGNPGGPCQVIRRIKDEVSNPAMQERMIKEVERGDDLSNQEAFTVYDVDVESGNKLIKKIEIGAHAQYRMDLRGIKVNDLRQTFQQFVKMLEDLNKRNPSEFALYEDDLMSGNKIEYLDPRSRLFVAFAATNTPGTVKVITTYRKGQEGHPRVPPGGCPV